MIQFNLLPDVKLEFVKAQRTKHLAVTISAVACAAAVAILLILLLVVDVWQKKSLNDLSGDIKTFSTQIQNTPNLNKILTIQNQLKSLPALDAQKPAVSQLFKYISQLTPQKAGLNKLTVDFTKDTWDIGGSADSLTTVDKFVDTLKFTTYKSNSGSTAQNAFSNVVLSNFGNGKQGSSYDITLTFAPTIFDASQDVTLTVPNIISTRSETQKPTSLFTSSTPSSNQ